MSSFWQSRCQVLAAGMIGFLLVSPALPQTSVKPLPKPEPVAETKLLMEGLNQANFQGLERILKEKPESAEAWAFARGQALLIAETANLLMLRPPKTQGQTIWLDRSADLRTAAARLARAAADKDLPRGRAGLIEVANSCNRCHQAFRISVRIAPFTDPADRNLRPPIP
ncbi:MAG TPA: cytochrome c [Gemmataceae bacterium]|nr:cytochrome c [Gemmataceae bacterium]